MPDNPVTESLFARWGALCDSAGLAGHDSFGALASRYQEPQRHYHTLQHLAECFAALDTLGLQPSFVMQWALWFHDAVYDPRSRDNEARSAQLALEEGERLGAPLADLQRAAAMILATSHHLANDPETLMLLDVDLAILAAAPERFAEYERQIRAEYAWVPGLLYRPSRRKVLRGFAERPQLFQLPAAHDRWEAAARANLQRALAA